MYILDTDICIYILTGRAPEVVERLRTASASAVGVTSITAAELRYGALHSKKPEKNLSAVEKFIAPLKQFDFDNRASIHYASIKQFLVAKGSPIGPMDLLISSIVRSVDATLVSNNTREFERVPNLRLENWKS